MYPNVPTTINSGPPMDVKDKANANTTDADLIQKLRFEKKSARDFQDRKHLYWNDNYDLFRDRPRTNRLTQRQAVNIPLMRETIKTLLSKIDDPPNVEWQEKSGDDMKELILQEIWDEQFEEQNFEATDMQDKKTVMLYGRAFRKLTWEDDTVKIMPLDIFDVVIDPLTDPLDIETARYLIHQNIFKSLREILADDRYSDKGRQALAVYMSSKEGVVQSSLNKQEYDKKIIRLKDMGVMNTEFPLFAGGDVIVNLAEHFTLLWNVKDQKFERRVIVMANDSVPLLDELLVDMIGVDFWPFITWGDDVETNDFWSDGIADLVRTPNKVINIWFSQLVENRTLRNFQMHWYDATIQGYVPQTYEPGPGRMLPSPGDPNKAIMPVEISGLDETMNSIEFLIGIVEKATAATAVTKGETPENATTLGEIQILLGSANERTLSMAKWYRRAWQELSMKWYRMMDTNRSKKFVLHKMSADGRIWPKTAYPSDWKSSFGYKAIVRSSSEQEQDQTKGLQKFQFLLQQFPNNSALKMIAQKRMLQTVDLTPEELRMVEEAEKQAASMPPSSPTPALGAGGAPQGGAPAQPAASPVNPQLLQDVHSRLKQFQNG